MTRPTRLVRDAGALAHNLAVVRRHAPAASVYAVVKADAYGHGAQWAAPVLLAHGADALAVACLEEAQSLRAAGVAAPILLLEGAIDADELHAARRLGLDTVVHRDGQLDDLLAMPEFTGRVWVKHDTGMGRLGFDTAGARRAWQALTAAGGARPGLMTHLARADEPAPGASEAQLHRFEALAGELGVGVLSAANSAGALAVRAPRTADGGVAWVRPGIALYGASPLADAGAGALGLRPAGTLESAVIAVKSVPAGASAGYGGTWTAARASRLAVVAAGYADGYPRHAPNGTPVLVGGRHAPLAGRVSMDMLTVDVTDLDAVAPGDRVVLWGEGLPAERVAALAGTIAYELMCRVSPRVRREDRP